MSALAFCHWSFVFCFAPTAFVRRRFTTRNASMILPLAAIGSLAAASAAVAYTVVAFDRISWLAVGLIAVGSLIGGFLGAHYGRRLSPGVLRAVIVVVGLIGLWRLLAV